MDMHKGIRVLLGTGLLTLALPLSAWARIVLLHTNDIHCGVNKNLPLARIAAERKELAKTEEGVLLADAGDAIQGEPLGKLTQGKAMVKLLNAAGYDFAIPGNHEFDYGMDTFLKLSKQLKCGYTSANFVDLKTGKTVLPAYRLFRFPKRTIALVGVTTPGTLVSSTPKYFQDKKGHFIYGFSEDKDGTKLYEQIQKAVDEARAKGAGTVILVGHLGSDGSIPVWSSEALIRHLTGVDGVIDGHSHEQYVRQVPDKTGRTIPLAQTGTKLQKLGKMIIEDDGTVHSSLVTELPAPDPNVEKLVKQELDKVDKELAKPVGVAQVALVQNLDGKRAVRNGETNLTDFVADAFRHTFKAQVAIVNGGSFRAGLPKGTWTSRDLMTMFPFGNQAVLRSVSGQQLLDALELSASLYPEENGGFLQVSGMTYTVDATIPSTVELDERGNFVRVRGERRVRDVMIDGKPIDPKEDYLVTGTSYILGDGGNGYSMLRDTTLIAEPGLSDMDVVAAYVKSLNGVVGPGYEDPRGQGRIHIVK